jgi:hypothetical protein
MCAQAKTHVGEFSVAGDAVDVPLPIVIDSIFEGASYIEVTLKRSPIYRAKIVFCVKDHRPEPIDARDVEDLMTSSWLVSSSSVFTWEPCDHGGELNVMRRFDAVRAECVAYFCGTSVKTGQQVRRPDRCCAAPARVAADSVRPQVATTPEPAPADAARLETALKCMYNAYSSSVRELGDFRRGRRMTVNELSVMRKRLASAYRESASLRSELEEERSTASGPESDRETERKRAAGLQAQVGRLLDAALYAESARRWRDERIADLEAERAALQAEVRALRAAAPRGGSPLPSLSPDLPVADPPRVESGMPKDSPAEEAPAPPAVTNPRLARRAPSALHVPVLPLDRPAPPPPARGSASPCYSPATPASARGSASPCYCPTSPPPTQDPTSPTFPRAQPGDGGAARKRRRSESPPTPGGRSAGN